MFWLRSTSYCRVMSLPRRAVAFQSIFLYSSPGTYSRRDSKTEPPPRMRAARMPSCCKRPRRASSSYFSVSMRLG